MNEKLKPDLSKEVESVVEFRPLLGKGCNLYVTRAMLEPRNFPDEPSQWYYTVGISDQGRIETTVDTCLRNGQPRTLSDDKGNAALERRGMRMLEPTEHHRDERVILGLIPSPFSYECIAACNQARVEFQQIACGKRVESTMALPHFFKPRVPGRNTSSVLAEHAYTCLIPYTGSASSHIYA